MFISRLLAGSDSALVVRQLDTSWIFSPRRILRNWFLERLFSERAEVGLPLKKQPCSIEMLGGQQSSGENPTRNRAWS
jgi:hypothetical protein